MVIKMIVFPIQDVNIDYYSGQKQSIKQSPNFR